MRKFIFIISSAIAFFSCSPQIKKFKGGLISSDTLATQTFHINNGSDTVLHTTKGAIITISSGTFDKDVDLNVREAYSMSDIVAAGLTTESDGHPLSTGGMIYVEANGIDDNFNKPIDIPFQLMR